MQRTKGISQNNRFFIPIRFLAEFVSRASTLITFPVMARYLGTEGYGVNAQVNTLLSFLVPLMTLGLGYGVVRIVAGKDDQFYVSARIKSSLSIVFCVSILTSFLVYLLAPIINLYFIKVDWAENIIRWSTPLLVISSLEMVIKDYFRARLHIIEYSIIQILQTVFYVAAVSWILVSGYGLLEVILAWSAIKLLFLIISVVYLIKAGDIVLDSPFMPRSEIDQLLRFGFPIVLAGLGTWFTQLGDRWVIGYYLDIDQVGIYNACYTLAGIISAIGSPFWSPLYPLMAAASNKNDNELLKQTCRRYMNAFCLLAFPAFFGLSILSNDLLQRFGSNSFVTNPLIFFFISIALLIDQLATHGYYLAFISNQTKFIRNITIATAVINLVLNIVLVPVMGIMGAAIATFVAYVLLDSFFVYRIRSGGFSIGELYDFPVLGKLLILSILMSAFVWVIRPLFSTSIVSLLTLVGSGGLFYAILCFIWARDLFTSLLNLKKNSNS